MTKGWLNCGIQSNCSANMLYYIDTKLAETNSLHSYLICSLLRDCDTRHIHILRFYYIKNGPSEFKISTQTNSVKFI
jgi:hypothetical protein